MPSPVEALSKIKKILPKKAKEKSSDLVELIQKYHGRLRISPGNVEEYIIFKRHLSKIVSKTSGFSDNLGVITKIMELME